GLDSTARGLQLKGRWNGDLIQRDLMISAGVFTGGLLMLWFLFRKWSSTDVKHE
nr:6K2 protein [Maize dwarf mosaic virus]